MNALQRFANPTLESPYYSLRFFLRKSKADPSKGTVYIRMTYEGTILDLGSTGVTAYYNNFDYSIPHDIDDVKREIKSKSLVSMIVEIKKKIEQLHPTTAHHIRDVISGKQKIDYTLIELMRKCMNESPDIKAAETLKSWRSKIARFEEYLRKIKNPNIKPASFGCVNLTNYIEYLKTEGLSHSTIPKHRDKITKTMAWATVTGILKENPLRDFKLYGIKTNKKSKKALTWSTIQRLREFHFEGIEKRAVDMFVFSACTGICYTDLKNLKDELHLGRDKYERLVISNNRQKTVVAEFCTPLQGYALDIYKEYGALEKIVSIDNSTVNKLIKYCFERIGLSQALSKKITFHSARHTFITYCKNEKQMIDESIMRLSGHENKKSIQDYIFIDNNSAIDSFYAK